MKLDIAALKNLHRKAVFDFKSISPDRRKELQLAAVAFVLLMGLAALSIKNFFWLLNSSSDEGTQIELTSSLTPEKDIAEIDAVVCGYDDYIKYRASSRQMAALASSEGCCPVSDASSLTPGASDEEYPVGTNPPSMTIKALIILDGEGAATVDIDNERAGMVVRKGSTFAGGRGKITAIDADGVSWTWAGKNYRTGL